jgi:mono/diheme cytochrome c family protein
MKWLIRLVVVLLVLVGAGLVYVLSAYPAVAAAEPIRIASTPERIARGKYLFDHVTVCVDCHSTRDFTRYAGPVVSGTHGKGGEAFTREMDMPGNFYARNITPAALADWTDGEIVRALTAGVNKQGDALFPLMPYLNYGALDREDIEAIVAYMRTLTPIVNHVPARQLDFPMHLIIRTMPQQASFAGRPAPTDRVAYGAYLARMASCADCHTRRSRTAHAGDGLRWWQRTQDILGYGHPPSQHHAGCRHRHRHLDGGAVHPEVQSLSERAGSSAH